MANFRKEIHKRVFEGIDKDVDFDINHTSIAGLDFFETSDGFTVYQDGQIILQYDEDIVKWRYFNRSTFNGFLFVLTNESVNVYELLTSGNKDFAAMEGKKYATRSRVVKYRDLVKHVFGDTACVINNIDEIYGYITITA